MKGNITATKGYYPRNPRFLNQWTFLEIFQLLFGCPTANFGPFYIIYKIQEEKMKKISTH